MDNVHNFKQQLLSTQPRENQKVKIGLKDRLTISTKELNQLSIIFVKAGLDSLLFDNRGTLLPAM